MLINNIKKKANKQNIFYYSNYIINYYINYNNRRNDNHNENNLNKII